MKQQLQGIALILLGILFALFEVVGRLYIPIVGSILLDWGFSA